MSIAQFNSLYTAAAAALDSGDYAAAIVAATKAQFLMGSPSLERAIGSGSQRITWRDSEDIERFIANCRKLAKSATVASSGAFAQSKVTYARASDG